MPPVFDWWLFTFSDKNLERVKKVLDELNMVYFVGCLERFEMGFCIYPDGTQTELPILEQVPIYVARKPEVLEELLNAVDTHDEYSLGRLYGYPETAIQAYLGYRDRFMGNMFQHPCGYFAQFVFSRDFFEEEYEIPLKWAHTVKRLSPKMYEEISRIDYRKIMIGACIE